MAGSGERRTKTETERERLRKACIRHLRDLKQAYGRPPPDVAVKPTSLPVRIEPPPASSNCTSPSALCAELSS